MGGNSRALDLSGQIKQWRGKPAFAEKVDLTRIPRSIFQFDLTMLIESINEYHNQTIGEPIWSPEALAGNLIYNGSSMLFMDNHIDDLEFLKVKKQLGDIDVTVPTRFKNSLWSLLKDLEGVQLTENVIYVGSNRPTETSIGQQINSVLEYMPTKSLFQIDWEFVEYKDGIPTEWSKFSKSASWDDMQVGIKGVFHKYLLRAITRVSDKLDVTVLTPSSGTATDEQLRLLNSAYLKAIHENSNEEEISLHKQIVAASPKISKPFIGKKINRYAFSVLYGIRDKIDPIVVNGNPLIVDNKPAVKIRAVQESSYLSEPTEIFEVMFQRKPTGDQLKQFGSFVGLVELIKDRTDLQAIVDEFINIMWGIDLDDILEYITPLSLTYGGQALERDSWERDRDIKTTALNYLLEHTNIRLEGFIVPRIHEIYYGKDGDAYFALRSGPRKEEE